jgi:alkylation response protein AidB-like acyl-CoA dehydrogenase
LEQVASSSIYKARRETTMTTVMTLEGKVDKRDNQWTTIVQELGPDFASRATQHDAEDSFVAENYELMRQRKLFSAAVPAELGGGGASHAEICTLLRELGHYDGSTALAFSMHSHLLAALVWSHQHNLTPPAELVLRRIAAEELALVSTGGSDWLDGSGVAVKEGDGYRVSGRKVFSSGSPSGHLLLTSAVYDDPKDGPTVLHFAVNLKGEGVTILDDWRALGMRGTGSNSVILDGVYVPEAGVSLRRPQGKWHRFFDVIAPLALPLVMSVYVGVAEAARDIALSRAVRKKDEPTVQGLIGEMDTELLAAQNALQSMIELAATDYEPNLHNSNLTFRYKTLAVRGVIHTVEKAMEVVGGASYFRSLGLERCFRDVQGARFHPLQEQRQYMFSGRVALGLDPVE